MKDKIRKFLNSFFGRIVIMVLIGIALVATTVSYIVINMSEDIFTKTYGDSQEKVFSQINEDLDVLYERLQKVCEAIDESWAFRVYLNEGADIDNIQIFQNIYQMEKDLDASKSLDLERLNILVIGMNGNHYLPRTETISMTDDEILNSDAAKAAYARPELLQFTYSEGGFTSTSKNESTIIVSKALYYKESKEIYGIVFITLTMDNLKRYYDYFVTDNTSFFMINSDGIVMCSDETELVGKHIEEDWYEDADRSDERVFTEKNAGYNLTIMKSELSYYDSSIYGVIDNKKALDELYNVPTLIFICIGISVVVLVMCLVFTRQTTVPLSQMVEKMSNSRDGNFTETMPVVGTVEARKLAQTYNEMLFDIEKYIDELLDTQKKQRTAEIKALQMQINPHYIYNTLAGIKWLVYQNDTDKTIKTIDAFIELLRNTISNSDEYITIEQELNNIKNYILIHKTRYDDQISCEYYISSNCYDCLLPKMILQPFIENAFFHAFPSGRRGTVQIFIKKKDDILEIEISDDGVGMDESYAKKTLINDTKKEHFSGIGMHNVQERLKLLYGENYGVTIKSLKNEGTTVIIRIPVIFSENPTPYGNM